MSEFNFNLKKLFMFLESMKLLDLALDKSSHKCWRVKLESSRLGSGQIGRIGLHLVSCYD
jgi:hypothetical protein